MPTSRATTSTGQLSGGSSRATALSLNICPYRAICVFHRRPQVFASIGATTILTQGGSKGRVENVASIQGTSNVQIRESLVKDGVMAPQHGLYVFTRDHLFPSPSQAAMALMGRSANGWVEWKSVNGKTLDELKRQAVATVN